MKFFIIIPVLMILGLTSIAQVIIGPKGTKVTLDSSKWILVGNDIYNKNIGKVGIGTSIPSAQLHTTSDVRFEGIGTNTTNNNILTSDINGNISTRTFSNFLSSNIISDSNLSKVPSKIFKGRISPGSGNLEDLSAAQATSMLNIFTTTSNGIVPSSGEVNENTFLRSDGTWSIPSIRKFSSLLSDINNSTRTLTPVTGLSFNVVANTTYRFRAMIPCTSNQTNNGMRWTIDGPSASLIFYSSRYSNGTNSETINYCNNYQQPSAANNNSVSYSIVIIEGLITPSANGIIQVLFASGGGGIITAKSGSTIEYW